MSIPTQERTERIGTLPWGNTYKLTVKIEWHAPSAPRQTVDHGVLAGFWRLSLIGDEYARFGKLVACGQSIDDFTGPFAKTAPGWSERERADLGAIWRRWHLNDLNAPCRHQEWFPTTVADWTGAAAAQTARCPVGYKYGSSWLVEPLPQHVLDYLAARFGFDFTPPSA